MKEAEVTIIGPEPACMRCQAAKRVAEKVAEKLKQAGIIVKVEKANIMSKDIVSKYGILVSPAIAVDGVVKFAGRVPSETEVERTIKEAVEKET
ncbi:MAG: thioredoxin family protein [Candidatus Bathyarchaeia archaeon]